MPPPKFAHQLMLVRGVTPALASGRSYSWSPQ
jgi:hypothetical protein